MYDAICHTIMYKQKFEKNKIKLSYVIVHYLMASYHIVRYHITHEVHRILFPNSNFNFSNSTQNDPNQFKSTQIL
jgi:hypothetical protein